LLLILLRSLGGKSEEAHDDSSPSEDITEAGELLVALPFVSAETLRRKRSMVIDSYCIIDVEMRLKQTCNFLDSFILVSKKNHKNTFRELQTLYSVSSMYISLFVNVGCPVLSVNLKNQEIIFVSIFTLCLIANIAITITPEKLYDL
jgi:hypothetical protein